MKRAAVVRDLSGALDPTLAGTGTFRAYRTPLGRSPALSGSADRAVASRQEQQRRGFRSTVASWTRSSAASLCAGDPRPTAPLSMGRERCGSAPGKRRGVAFLLAFCNASQDPNCDPSPWGAIGVVAVSVGIVIGCGLLWLRQRRN